MTIERTLVIGSDPGALRAAAALASTGRDVTLLALGPTPSGLTHPEIPVDTGLSLGSRPLVGVLGELASYLAPRPALRWTRACAHGGRLLGMPPRLWEAAHLFAPTDLPRATLDWASARLASWDTGTLGLWTELRTFEDVMVRVFGRRPFERLLSAYCAKRWGPPDQIAASVAGDPPHRSGVRVVPSCGPSAALAHLAAFLEQRGAEVLTGVVIEAIEAPSRGTGLHTVHFRHEGRHRTLVTDQDLWLAAPPADVARWLGPGLDPGLATDAALLRTRDALQVLVPVTESGDLPTEVHLLDDDVPFYRLVRPSVLPGCRDLADHVVLHANADPASRTGLAGATDAEVANAARHTLDRLRLEGPLDGAVLIERLPGHEPIWTPTWHPARTRLLLGLFARGIRLVGRMGAFAPLGEAAEWELLEALLAPIPTASRRESEDAIREIYRLYVDPQVPTRVS